METPILDTIFCDSLKNSFVITYDTQGPQEYQYHWKQLQGHICMHNMALKLPQNYFAADKKVS